MNDKMLPINGNVLLKLVEPDKTTKSGIILVQGKQEPTTGEVIRVGKDSEVSVGQVVVFKPWSGVEIELDNEKYYFVAEEDLLAIKE